MKRSFSEREVDHNNLALANCLMLLSQGPGNKYHEHAMNNNNRNISTGGRLFECKTCNRQFPSFQALGGHRASHKKPKLMEGMENQPPAKPKTHECSICGLEFGIGQALGGHMRRHRAGLNEDHLSNEPVISTPFVKKVRSSTRIFCLDLNLTPLENDLQLFKFDKAALNNRLFLVNSSS